MTKRTRQPTTGSEFDAFLYASIGLESDGTFLSVLSALARLNVDPWDEAARLARLPREAASRFLANLICAQPGGPGTPTDPQLQAQRLTALLPPHAAGESGSDQSTIAGIKRNRWQLIRPLMFYVILSVLFFGSQWIVQNLWGARSSKTTAAAPQSVPTPAPNHP